MHINELSKILNQHFNFYKARSDCFAQLVIAMITVKTVNFTHLATYPFSGVYLLIQSDLCNTTFLDFRSFPGRLFKHLKTGLLQTADYQWLYPLNGYLATAFITESFPESCYKRIQRFFRFLKLDPFAVASMVITLFDLKNKKLNLALDRTNWKFGKLDINILMLTVAYRGIALPLMWSCLKKRGNSNTSERINLIKRILLLIGPDNIDCLLGDREFVGAEWIKWLDEQNVPFLFRIRNNSLLEGVLPVNAFFRRLSPHKKVKNGKIILWGRTVYLSTRWSYNKGELVTIISNRKFQRPFNLYRKRWEIETFFGCLKKRGFCFEDTHLTHIFRIEKLICVLTIAFCWSHLVGQAKEEEAPIDTKSHGRKAKSVFRYGFDELRGIFLNPRKKISLFLKWLKLLIVNEKFGVC